MLNGKVQIFEFELSSWDDAWMMFYLLWTLGDVWKNLPIWYQITINFTLPHKYNLLKLFIFCLNIFFCFMSFFSVSVLFCLHTLCKRSRSIKDIGMFRWISRHKTSERWGRCVGDEAVESFFEKKKFWQFNFEDFRKKLLRWKVVKKLFG